MYGFGKFLLLIDGQLFGLLYYLNKFYNVENEVYISKYIMRLKESNAYISLTV